jgi:hypothetical protein
MNHDLRFLFDADKQAKGITVKKEFAGHRQLVWNYHTRSELLDQWFAPKGLMTMTKHMEFEAGGYWHYAMVMPDGQSFWSRLDYETVDPIDGYSALNGFCDESGEARFSGLMLRAYPWQEEARRVALASRPCHPSRPCRLRRRHRVVPLPRMALFTKLPLAQTVDDYEALLPKRSQDARGRARRLEHALRA